MVNATLTEDGEPGKPRAANAQEHTQQQRVSSLLEAKTRVLDIEKEIEEGLLLGIIDEQTANHVLRRAVEHYIYEVEPLVKQDEYRADYWGELQERDDGSQVWVGPGLGSMSLPNGGTYRFHGLSDVVDAPNPIVVEWTEHNHSAFDGGTTTHRRETRQIPRRILMNAFRRVNAFLYELGVDLNVEEAEQQTKISRELLEEVDEWRKQNIEN